MISLLSSRLESMQKELFSCVEEGISLEVCIYASPLYGEVPNAHIHVQKLHVKCIGVQSISHLCMHHYRQDMIVAS